MQETYFRRRHAIASRHLPLSSFTPRKLAQAAYAIDAAEHTISFARLLVMRGIFSSPLPASGRTRRLI